ncbi:hypothetical protein RHMOL_Rhmol05G0202600 [Rhododendron molle]|uniref:Uncharacterized protein n=1 Tax=Rhododendron molle TaxID=49168 RepID=A0ACC0NRH7_RHOML|nr:hypothetical protein RHMOL_Rhmol05G0202600 [Rhododendron molle]
MMVGVVWMLVLSVVVIGHFRCLVEARPRRILMDTDVNMDDIFALFYVLKQNRSEFDLQVSPFFFFFSRNLNIFSFLAITINTNEWSDAGHAVDHIYDILFMMDRDDIPVGVGGEGVISPNGTIIGHVGGYLPIIDQPHPLSLSPVQLPLPIPPAAAAVPSTTAATTHHRRPPLASPSRR